MTTQMRDADMPLLDRIDAAISWRSAIFWIVKALTT